MHLRSILQSRVVTVLGVALAVVVPALTLPRLPHVTIWPVLIGLVPWVVGKYVLCPLRWHVLTRSGLGRWWHIRANAEAELIGMFTPGHVGADVWRFRKLTSGGLSKPDAIASVGLDRLVGAVGLAVFVVFAGASLPSRMLLVAVGVSVAILVAGLVIGRVKPELLPRGPLPPRRDFATALLLSAAYQLTIAALLLGALASTGYTLSPIALLGAFGASQLAGAIPGPSGASPRDVAFMAALVALGVPWVAAIGAVTLKTALAWLPALMLGGTCLLIARSRLVYSLAAWPVSDSAELGSNRPVMAAPR